MSPALSWPSSSMSSRMVAQSRTLKGCNFVNTIGSSRLSAEETLGFLGLLYTGWSWINSGGFARSWCVIDLSFCLKCSLFCSLQFCIVIFEFACLVVQSIVCNHDRFNATPFIESFQLKCSWKLSELTESAQIGSEWTVSTPRVFSLGLWRRCQRLWLSSWHAPTYIETIKGWCSPDIVIGCMHQSNVWKFRE